MVVHDRRAPRHQHDPHGLRPRPLQRRQDHLRPVLAAASHRERLRHRDHRQGPQHRRARPDRLLQRGLPQHARREQRHQAAARRAHRREARWRSPWWPRPTRPTASCRRRRAARATRRSCSPPRPPRRRKQAWRRFAEQAPPVIVLANANAIDSLSAGAPTWTSCASWARCRCRGHLRLHGRRGRSTRPPVAKAARPGPTRSRCCPASLRDRDSVEGGRQAGLELVVPGREGPRGPPSRAGRASATLVRAPHRGDRLLEQPRRSRRP